MNYATNYKFKQNVLYTQENFLNKLLPKEKNSYLLSLKNYIERKTDINHELYNSIQIGDVCFFDFGHGYEREIGYQHLGIVLTKSQYNLFVVPLISLKTDPTLEDIVQLMQCPTKTIILKGNGKLNQDTIAYINDAKWLNYIRTIRIIGNIETNSTIFKELKKKTIDLLYNSTEGKNNA